MTRAPTSLLRCRGVRVEPAHALYRTYLGDLWPLLHPVVQRAHVHGGPVSGIGHFHIRRGPRLLARLLATLLLLPRTQRSVRTHLFVLPEAGEERWIRRFGKRYLITTQRRGQTQGDGRAPFLVEQFHLLEMRFVVEPDNTGLRYRQVSAALAWRRFRIPLPRIISPIVEGWEHPADKPGCTRVQVEVTIAIIGRLIRYDGVLGLRKPRT